MKAKRFPVSLALSFLVVLAAGCTSHPLILEFNGRVIEVQEMQQASFPRGLEITYFDGRLMKVNGREAIKLNGKDLTVKESNVSHGAARHVLGPKHRCVIEKGGKVTVVEQKAPGGEGSWWAFWR